MPSPRRPRALLAAAALTASLAVPAVAAPDRPTDGPRSGAAHSQLLPEVSNGRGAIEALGANLGEAAARNGLSRAQLVAQLEEDDSLHLDEQGMRLFIDELHVDEEHHEEAATGDSLGGQLATDTAIPAAGAFQLASRPSADRTIFLDFDGFTTTGTAWARDFPAVAGGFSLDGDASTFSTAERQVVIEVWQRVAEDFAPFEVNVTTITPTQAQLDRSSTDDLVYGTTVAFVDDDARASYGCSCGGVAYVGIFDRAGDNSHHAPAWVFAEALGGNAKSMAEAASHEAGHTLGLRHDGGSSSSYYRGHDGWAPIMGVGYNEPVTQWSRGEYTGATQTQNDLAVIVNNGLPLVGDDHGDTAADATPLAATIDEVGVIGTDDDVDVFAIEAAAGPLSVVADVADAGANLDIRLTLRDSTGGIVATDDSSMLEVSRSVATGLDASISTSVAAGGYTLHVEGVGVRDADTGYTGYGSLGAYSLVGLFTAGDGSGGDPAPNRAPTAALDVTVDGMAVTVDGTSSSDPDGEVVAHAWAFGDGTRATGTAATHTYTTAGTYTIRLRVDDDAGATDRATVDVTVEAQPTANVAPTASFTTSVDGSTVAVDGSSSSDRDGEVVAHDWSFGDGATGAGATATHTYDAAGSYMVRLTVTDDRGATRSVATAITVPEREQPPTAPADVSATAEGGVVTVAWEGVAAADGYVVVREKRHHGNGRWIGQATVADVGVGATEVTDQPGEGTFRYRVVASNATGTATSAWTAPVTVSGTGGDGGDTGGNGGGNGNGNGKGRKT